MLLRSGPSKGDVSRDRHVRRAGMRWTQQCGAFLWRDDRKAAYGEVVWSWRRDRGVYPARLVAGLATVTKNAAHRGEHEVSRKAIARGRPGCLGCTCQTRVRFSTIAHGAAGAVGARLSLRPFVTERDNEMKTRTISCRENIFGCHHPGSPPTLKLRRRAHTPAKPWPG